MNAFMKGILFILLTLYVVSPIDLAPGIIDDILLLLVSMASQIKVKAVN